MIINKKRLSLVLTLLIFAISSILILVPSQIANQHIWTYLGTSDNRFHMMRIEGLSDALKNSNVFPKINMSFIDGFGYVVNLFYSNFMLYPAAILRLLGLSMSEVTVIYFFILNFLTFISSFWSFKKINGFYWNSLIFSFMYTLSAYRLHNLLFRYDLGELGAFIFLPIAFVGIYNIFYGDKKQWIALTLGITGIIYCHPLSPLLVAFLILCCVVLNIKEIRKDLQIIFSLAKATGVSILLSLAYFLPMIEQLKNMTFKLVDAKPNLELSASKPMSIMTDSFNNNISQPTLGVIVFLALIVMWLNYKYIEKKSTRQLLVLGSFLLVMSTNLFPWIIVQKTFLKILQFPWRLDMIITLLFCFVFAENAVYFFNTNLKRYLLLVIILVIGVASGRNLVKMYPNNSISYAKYNSLDTYSIGAGQEYLPLSSNLEDFKTMSHNPRVVTGFSELSAYKKQGDIITLRFKDARKTKLILPILYYKGYTGIINNQERIKVTASKKYNGLATVNLTGSGILKVKYKKTLIQRVSALISTVTLFIIIGFRIFKKAI
ncbi:hypothetical protein [Latilactobacillus curvatus]|uniref:hypothetical protein n=1 Tax=Latilactobacillus curvatus TaxID=28038 RepID=UPI0039B09370